MENVRKNIDEFFKSFEGKSFENDKEVYNELVTYARDKDKLEKADALYDVSYEELKKYTYEKYYCKPGATFFSKNTEDYYWKDDALLYGKNDLDRLLNSILNGNDFYCKFFKQFFGDNEEFIKSCKSDKSLIEYLSKVQNSTDLNKEYSNNDDISMYDREKLNYLKAVIKFLKENKKARDCILIAQKLYRRTNLEKFEITIRNRAVSPKILVSNTMNGFIYVSVFGNQLRELNRDSEIKLYMTIKEDKTTDVMSDLGAFLLEKNIRCFYKTRPSEENDMLTIRIDEIDKLDELVNWLKNNKDIYFSNHPFMSMVDGVGISLDDGGSYNQFISETIYDYIINTKENLGYESFIKYINSKNYLSRLDNQENRLYDKNLNLALKGTIALGKFKEEYKTTIDNSNKYKALKSSFEKLEIDLGRSIKVYDDKAILDLINTNLDVIKMDNNYTDMNNNDLLFSYYGKKVEDSSLIDYMYNVSSKKGYFAEENSKTRYYFGKIIERWNNEGGYNKIKEGISAFRSIALHDFLDENYSDEETKYLEEYNYLKNLAISCSSSNFGDATLERLLNRVIDEASNQFGVERNPKDAKPYALRKCYKKKKELEEQ